jgi:hypothetical protein
VSSRVNAHASLPGRRRGPCGARRAASTSAPCRRASSGRYGPPPLSVLASLVALALLSAAPAFADVGQLGPGVAPNAQVGPPVLYLAPAPEGALTEGKPVVAVAACSDGSVLRLVEEAAGQALARHGAGKLPGCAPTGLAWLGGAETTRVVALGDDGRLFRIGEAAGDEPQAVATHEGGAMCLAGSPDGALLATGGVDGTIRLWDGTSAKLGEPRGSLEGHAGPVAGLVFTKDGLWSVGWDATLRAWDLPSNAGSTARGKARGKPTPIGTRELTAVAAAPDGATLVVAGHDGNLHAVDAKRRKVTTLPQRKYGEWVRTVVFGPDGETAMAVLGAESKLWHFDPASPGRAEGQLDARVPASLCFLADGRLLVGRFDGSATVAAVPTLPAPVAGGKK